MKKVLIIGFIAFATFFKSGHVGIGIISFLLTLLVGWIISIANKDDSADIPSVAPIKSAENDVSQQNLINKNSLPRQHVFENAKEKTSSSWSGKSTILPTQNREPQKSNLNLRDFAGEDYIDNTAKTIEISKKNSTTTILICMLLGFLGMHSFYAGRTKAGIIRLVFVLLCILFTLMQNNFSILFFLTTFILTVLDFVKLVEGNYFDVDGKSIQPSKIVSALSKIIGAPFFVLGGLIICAVIWQN